MSSASTRATLHTSQRAVTLRLREPKRKCSKAVPRHIQNHVVWSRTLKCSVWSYVMGPSNAISMNFYLCGFLTHDRIEETNGCERSEYHGLSVLCQAYLQEVVFGK
jgi:hypothetical protein